MSDGMSDGMAHGGNSDVADVARTIRVGATSFAFDPSEIRTETGEDLAIELTSDDIEHDARIAAAPVRQVHPHRPLELRAHGLTIALGVAGDVRYLPARRSGVPRAR